MFRVVLEELRYCKRGSFSYDYYVDPDSVEFRRDEGFKEQTFDSKEDAILFAKKTYDNIWNRRFIRLIVIEDEDDLEHELWCSEDLPLNYEYNG